jgi:hypothetical protein
MYATYANPITLPLAMYRYWVNAFFVPAARAVDAAIDDAKTRQAEITNGARRMKGTGRRPPYISARIHRARQNGRGLS